MTEHPLEVEHASAVPQVVRGKGVPETVKCSFGRFKAELSAESFHISKNVSSPLLRPISRPEHQSCLRVALFLPKKQPFPEFEGNRCLAVLPPLTVERQQQIVEINVFPTQAEKFVDPGRRVTQSRNQCVQPVLRCRAGTPLHQSEYLSPIEGWQHSLFNFHFRYDDRESGPPTVRLDRLQTTSYGDWL